MKPINTYLSWHFISREDFDKFPAAEQEKHLDAHTYWEKNIELRSIGVHIDLYCNEPPKICGYCDGPVATCACNEPVNAETWPDRQA